MAAGLAGTCKHTEKVLIYDGEKMKLDDVKVDLDANRKWVEIYHNRRLVEWPVSEQRP